MNKNPETGWIVRGERMKDDKKEHFRSPPEPYTFPETYARNMAKALAKLHPTWKFSIIPPKPIDNQSRLA